MAGFDQHFCDVLSYHLTSTFGNSLPNDVDMLWCDGIKMPFVDSDLYKKNISRTKKIVTEAFIGPGVNSLAIYQMTIRFGQCALENHWNDVDMTACLPSDKTLKWVRLDTENKLIELQLK